MYWCYVHQDPRPHSRASRTQTHMYIIDTLRFLICTAGTRRHGSIKNIRRITLATNEMLMEDTQYNNELAQNKLANKWLIKGLFVFEIADRKNQSKLMDR
jgi:hypothetical protein